MEIFIKVLKFILYCILAVFSASALVGGVVFVVVGTFGLFDTLSNQYPDLYTFIVIILLGLVGVRGAWLIIDKIIIKRYINR